MPRLLLPVRGSLRAIARCAPGVLHAVLSPSTASAAVTVAALGYFVFGACATTLCVGGACAVLQAGPVACVDSLCGTCGGPVGGVEPDPAPPAVPPEPAPAALMSIERAPDVEQAY